jgi:hypothetical protein
MKKFIVGVFAALILMSAAHAGEPDNAMIAKADAVAASASEAIAAAQPGEDDDVPTMRNWRLRDNLGDIRDIANQVRDRAAKGKARGWVGKLKVKRIVANMDTCNFLVLHGAARGLEPFPASWATARQAIGDLVAELCCGGEDQ